MPFSTAIRLIQRSLLITNTPWSDRTACLERESSLGHLFPRRADCIDGQRDRSAADSGGPGGPPPPPRPPPAVVLPPRGQQRGPSSAQDAAERAGPATRGRDRLHPREQALAIGLGQPA